MREISDSDYLFSHNQKYTSSEDLFSVFQTVITWELQCKLFQDDTAIA